MYGGQLRGDAQTLKGEFQASATSVSAAKAKAHSIALTLRAMADELRVAYNSLTQLDTGNQLGAALKADPTCQAVFAKG